MVQGVARKRKYFVKFQDGGEKEMSLNQLAIVVISSEVEE